MVDLWHPSLSAKEIAIISERLASNRDGAMLGKLLEKTHLEEEDKWWEEFGDD